MMQWWQVSQEVGYILHEHGIQMKTNETDWSILCPGQHDNGYVDDQSQI